MRTRAASWPLRLLLRLGALAILLPACTAPDGGARPPVGAASLEDFDMPDILRLREEQSGVVGVTATEWRIEGDTLRCQRLVNERLISEKSRVLSRAELERVSAALAKSEYETIPPVSVRAVEANQGKLVVEADGKRWEIAQRAGRPPATAAPESTEGRVRAIADAVRALAASD
jgi:hypothetical protein